MFGFFAGHRQQPDRPFGTSGHLRAGACGLRMIRATAVPTTTWRRRRSHPTLPALMAGRKAGREYTVIDVAFCGLLNRPFVWTDRSLWTAFAVSLGLVSQSGGPALEITHHAREIAPGEVVLVEVTTTAA